MDNYLLTSILEMAIGIKTREISKDIYHIFNTKYKDKYVIKILNIDHIINNNDASYKSLIKNTNFKLKIYNSANVWYIITNEILELLQVPHKHNRIYSIDLSDNGNLFLHLLFGRTVTYVDGSLYIAFTVDKLDIFKNVGKLILSNRSDIKNIDCLVDVPELDISYCNNISNIDLFKNKGIIYLDDKNYQRYISKNSDVKNFTNIIVLPNILVNTQCYNRSRYEDGSAGFMYSV